VVDVVQDDERGHASVVLAPSAVAPGTAREFVTGTIAQWGLETDLGDVALVTSELVTNAVVHARSDVVVALTARRDCVRVEVGDRSSKYPATRQPTAAQSGGRGLVIVAKVSARWGVEATDGGKIVWSELTR
jgi:anti-sigma regulatory factor (Ser/Thr protein kinase)